MMGALPLPKAHAWASLFMQLFYKPLQHFLPHRAGKVHSIDRAKVLQNNASSTPRLTTCTHACLMGTLQLCSFSKLAFCLSNPC